MLREQFTLCNVCIINGKLACVILSSASHNYVLRGVYLDSYKKCMIKAVLDKKQHLIESGMNYIKDVFPATGKSFSPAVSVLNSVSWPSASDGLQEI
jgi:hypothetical protein